MMSKTIEELEGELEELEGELRDAKAEISGLRNELSEAEDAVGDWFDYDNCDDYVSSDVLSQVRKLVARGQYSDAIDYADRHLPARLRYAS